MASNPPAPPPGMEIDRDTFDFFVDSNGDLSLTGSDMEFSPTAQVVGPSADTVEMQLFIEDVLGNIDASTGHQIVDLEITAQIRFRALGAGITTCRTGSFTIFVQGDLGGVPQTISTAFTIPALSGSGTGACNGFASTLNDEFKLGFPGATLELYKDWAEDSTGAFLTGS